MEQLETLAHRVRKVYKEPLVPKVYVVIRVIKGDKEHKAYRVRLVLLEHKDPPEPQVRKDHKGRLEHKDIKVIRA